MVEGSWVRSGSQVVFSERLDRVVTSIPTLMLEFLTGTPVLWPLRLDGGRLKK